MVYLEAATAHMTAENVHKGASMAHIETAPANATAATVHMEVVKLMSW